jgi:hypothetical protein
MANYTAVFYVNDKMVCQIWTPCKDERELYRYISEPLFRHGCQKGLSLKYQKEVFTKAFRKLAVERDKSPDDISALATTFMLVDKFKTTPDDLEILIIKDKFNLYDTDAVKTQKKDISKVIQDNVRTAEKHTQQRFKTRTSKRNRKGTRF